MQTQHFLSTNELADRLKVQGATIRRGLCVDGHYLGMKPHKLPNRRLLWSKNEADKLLSQDQEGANA